MRVTVGFHCCSSKPFVQLIGKVDFQFSHCSLVPLHPCPLGDRVENIIVTGWTLNGLRYPLIAFRARAFSKMVLMAKAPGMMDDFGPVMPSLIRLIAGVIVLFVVQGIVLGLPGFTQLIPSTSFTMSVFAAFSIGLAAAFVVLKFGTQFSDAVADAYKSFRAYVPLLTYLFQIAAIYILYNACKAISSGFFTSAPWAYPLIFLTLAVIPTVKTVVNIVHALEGHEQQRHVLKQFA